VDLLSGAANITLFTDDAKISLEITDVSALPSFLKSIDDIATWSSTWHIKLAINKCQHIHFSLSRSVALPQLWLHSNILTNSTLCRDIGVNIDSRLSYCM